MAGTVEVRADDVFLSPRVVDEGAFGEFSARLRSLLTEADRAGAMLSSATGVARQAGETVGAMFQQQAERVAALQRLLKALEEHQASAGALLRAMEERERRAADAEAALKSRLAEVEEHIGSLVRNAENQLASRIDAAAKEEGAASRRFGALEVRVSIVESLAERVHDLAARVERLMEARSNRSLADADEPFETSGAGHDTTSALEAWSQLRQEATTAGAAVTAANGLAMETANRLEDAATRADDLLEQVDGASDDMMRLLRKGDTLANLLVRLTGPQELVGAGAGDESGACGAD